MQNLNHNKSITTEFYQNYSPTTLISLGYAKISFYKSALRKKYHIELHDSYSFPQCVKFW